MDQVNQNATTWDEQSQKRREGNQLERKVNHLLSDNMNTYIYVHVYCESRNLRTVHIVV